MLKPFLMMARLKQKSSPSLKSFATQFQLLMALSAIPLLLPSSHKSSHGLKRKSKFSMFAANSVFALKLLRRSASQLKPTTDLFVTLANN